MKDHFHFVKHFIKNPATTGAIAPSSKYLAREIVRQAGIAKADTILEFGPGTGAFTMEILNTKKENANFIAVEKNEHMVSVLKNRFPQLNLHNDCIENILSIMKSSGIENKADSIVCGLPWAAFDDDLQKKLLDATRNALRPGGIFTTFAYLQGVLLPAGWKFKKAIHSVFSKVHRSPIVWRNLPPAFIYKCTN